MRFLVPLFVFLAVAAFHSALSASLESAEKEEVDSQHDGLTELQKIDQMEFEAAQKKEAAQMNVTEEQNEDSRYLEAVQDESVEERAEAEAEAKRTAEGGGRADSTAQQDSWCVSSEEDEERREPKPRAVSSVDQVSQDSTKDEDVLE